jgi:hypothetical protein
MYESLFIITMAEEMRRAPASAEAAQSEVDSRADQAAGTVAPMAVEALANEVPVGEVQPTDPAQE